MRAHWILPPLAMLIAACGPGQPQESASAAEQPLRYDVEYPAVGYSSAPLSGRVARFEADLASGRIVLERDERLGLLPSLLEALDIDPASQVLVFSKTSFQVRSIAPETPRALYFNDDTYVAALHGSDVLEIASMDPRLGPIFHTIEPSPEVDEASATVASVSRVGGPPRLERQMHRCLRCHDSLSMTGGGVPRFILGSGYIGSAGNLISHEGWIMTTQRTPLRSRWGGWYVTGQHGEQLHLGNVVVHDAEALSNVDSLRVGNLSSLEGRVDTGAYLTDTSDIVALLVLQHQVDVQNQITRVQYDLLGVSAESQGGGGDGSSSSEDVAFAARVAEVSEPLVEALFFAGETPLSGRITGRADYTESFQARGPHDAQGRSLRELDLERRLLRYPLSWLVYSEAFLELPAAAKAYVYGRIAEVLNGEGAGEPLPPLSPAERQVITEILRDTHPELAVVL